MKIRRILAGGSAALIILLYVLSVIFAVIGNPFSRQLLMASIFCSIIIPVILYGYLIYSRNTGRKEEANKEEITEEKKEEDRPAE